MDKWDHLAEMIVRAAPREEKADAQTLANCAADAGRAIETISSDLDRIATALEKLVEQ